MNEKIDKIVELGIDIDNMDEEIFDELGVDVISLVENPAIEVDFLAFNREEFVEPRAGESEEEFINRCMSELSNEFPDQDQRVAVCYSYWEGKEETSQEFSFTDYPQAVSDNAARGIRLNEKIDNICATQVGKVRAQQLANREAISEETVKRMYSYLSRAREYYKPDDTEACGTISYLLWGGDEALRWSERKLKQIEEELSKNKDEYATEEEQEAILAYAMEHGENIKAEDIVVDLSASEFNTVTDVLRGISALDILNRLNIKKDQPAETRYRYAGPPAERKFCKAMLYLNKMYTRKDIIAMVNINKPFGHGDGGAPYSKWSYKGGVNCKHYWEEVAVFKGSNNQNVIIVKGPATGNAGIIPYDMPKHGYYSQTFALNEEKRIVTGPVMIPNRMILRRDEDGTPFYVYFTMKTVRKMLEKFLKKNNQHYTDVDHDGNVKTDNTLLETWISEHPTKDKSHALGFNLPVGTWFASYKINNDEDWFAIKEGRLKGFSLAGNFLERIKPAPELTEENRKLEDIKNILRNVDK